MHRLDRETSGAIVVARTADAAAWLSQAFRQHAADAVETPARGSQATSSRTATSHLKQGAGPGIRGDTLITSVEKTYLALVETAGMYQTLPDTGRVDLPILSGKGDAGESWRAAATAFRVLARSQDFTLLELRPETGVCSHLFVLIIHYADATLENANKAQQYFGYFSFDRHEL